MVGNIRRLQSTFWVLEMPNLLEEYARMGGAWASLGQGGGVAGVVARGARGGADLLERNQTR